MRLGTDNTSLVLFALDEHCYALPLSVVERVVRAVAITPLPKSPEIVLGIINVRGQVVPVVDLRRRLELSPRELKLEDRFIIAITAKRVVALAADSVAGVREIEDHQVIETGPTLSLAPYLKGAAKLPDGLVLIYDLDKFLSLDEENALEAALSRRRE